MEDRLEKQISFLKEIDKEKFIERRTRLTDGRTRENDAEHAWHMAIMTILLAEYANEKIDVLRTVTMLLIHDLVEIDAGDTYAYDEEGKKTQAEREKKAADRIYNMLPEDQARALYDIWLEFEAQETPEAKFARTMDNFQPAMLTASTGGFDWKARGVKWEQVQERNRKTADGSQTLWEYAYEHFFKPNIENGNISSE